MTEWQLTIDCADPSRMVVFWAAALGYEVAPPPAGYGTWNDWYRSVGVPESELDPIGDGADRLVDPTGRGPRIWFQQVPELKVVKNRLHLDLFVSGGRGTPIDERVRVVDARAAELVALGATVLHRVPVDDGVVGHYGVTLQDPEGNEFCVT